MSARRLPDLVVVALGSNAAVSGEELDYALELAGPFARLILVLPKELGGAPDPDGRLMRAFAEAHPDQVGIVDWPAYSAGHGDWFAPDGLHLTTDGALGFAQMITEAVEFAPVEPVEPLDLTLDAKNKQKAKKLEVDVACGGVDCSVDFSGKGKVPKSAGAAVVAAKSKKFKLKPKDVEVAAGATETVRLKFKKNRKSVKKIKRLLKQGTKKTRKRAKAVVKATATGAGGTDSAKQTVKLKR
jgi:hypothetical protein